MTAEERLGRLERHNRRLWWFAITALIASLAAIAVGLSGISDDKDLTSLTARHFEVVDESGNVVVTIGESPKGGGSVVVHNQESQPIALLTTVGGGGQIITMSSEGMPLVNIGVTENGNGSVKAFAKDKMGRTLDAD